MQCQKQRIKREGKQYSKAQDSEQNLRQKPSVWRFFLENNKASSVLTALGVRVQKSMEQDTGSAMIPRFLKQCEKFIS